MDTDHKHATDRYLDELTSPDGLVQRQGPRLKAHLFIPDDILLAKLNNVGPLAWLTDTLRRIVSGQTKRNQLDTLLPWNWKQHSDVAPVNSE